MLASAGRWQPLAGREEFATLASFLFLAIFLRGALMRMPYSNYFAAAEWMLKHQAELRLPYGC
jgi:hypothetical protein